MKKLLLLFSLWLLFASACFGQLVLTIPQTGIVNAPIDPNGWQNFKVTLTQNITFGFVILPPTPAPAQSTLRVIFAQDATGGRVVNFAANITSPCAINAAANAITICSFTFDNTTNAWQGVGGGGPTLVAKADAVAQQANIPGTTLYAIPANSGGLYRVSAYAVVTQAATTSSTLPSVAISYTDSDANAGGNGPAVTATSSGNLVGGTNSTNGLGQSGTLVINAKAGTSIAYDTVNYASSGATPMQYAVHIKLEYLGQ